MGHEKLGKSGARCEWSQKNDRMTRENSGQPGQNYFLPLTNLIRKIGSFQIHKWLLPCFAKCASKWHIIVTLTKAGLMYSVDIQLWIWKLIWIFLLENWSVAEINLYDWLTVSYSLKKNEKTLEIRSSVLWVYFRRLCLY